MQSEPNAATFFNGFAETFDTIYDGKRNPFMRWVDCKFRSDMFVRYAMTFDALGDLRGKTVFDVGCGSGPYIIETLQRGARLVTGLDPAPNMLSLAHLRLQRGRFEEGRFALIEGKFPGYPVEPHDHAIVMGVMDYVEDAEAFLTALRPLIKQSAVISFPSRHWFRTPFREIRYRIRQCPVYFYNEPMIKDLCSAAGFSFLDLKKIPGAGMDYHVCLRP